MTIHKCDLCGKEISEAAFIDCYKSVKVNHCKCPTYYYYVCADCANRLQNALDNEAISIATKAFQEGKLS